MISKICVSLSTKDLVEVLRFVTMSVRYKGGSTGISQLLRWFENHSIARGVRLLWFAVPELEADVAAVAVTEADPEPSQVLEMYGSW